MSIRRIYHVTTRSLTKWLFGAAFADPKFSLSWLLKFALTQKVLGINRHVPWPVHWTSQVKGHDKIDRGDRFPGASMGVYIDGRNGIQIGTNTWIGPRVSLVSMNHTPYDFTQYENTGPIVIGNNCWLATNVVILPGVRLGNHVVCAAGAVVTQSFEEDNLLLGGVPAKIIKRLPDYQNADNANDKKREHSSNR